MEIPTLVTFRNCDHSASVEELVKRKAQKLEHFCDHITSCRVLIEVPHQHKNKGCTYHVRIDLTIPGREIVVNRDTNPRGNHEDIRISLRDAFEAAQRQIQDSMGRWEHSMRSQRQSIRSSMRA